MKATSFVSYTRGHMKESASPCSWYPSLSSFMVFKSTLGSLESWTKLCSVKRFFAIAPLQFFFTQMEICAIFFYFVNIITDNFPSWYFTIILIQINLLTLLSKIFNYLNVQRKLFIAICTIINAWWYRPGSPPWTEQYRTWKKENETQKERLFINITSLSTGDPPLTRG